jgi:hypothetical protein
MLASFSKAQAHQTNFIQYPKREGPFSNIVVTRKRDITVRAIWNRGNRVKQVR